MVVAVAGENIQAGAPEELATLRMVVCEGFGQAKEHVILVTGRAEIGMEQAGGGVQVKAAAVECGFTDLQYFIRCFRQRFGFTPGEYRKRSED